MAQTNKLSKEMREKVITTLKSTKVHEVLATEVVDGTISMNVTDGIRLEIQEYDILLINRRSGDVAKAFDSVDSALEGDHIFKFIESYRFLPVHIDQTGRITVEGNSYDNDAVGLWTDGFNVIYLDSFSDSIVYQKNLLEEEDEAVIENLVDFDDYDDNYDRHVFYRRLREYILKPENSNILNTIVSTLPINESKRSKEFKDVIHDIIIYGVSELGRIDISYSAELVEELYGTRKVTLTPIFTEDKCYIIYSKRGELDVMKEFRPSIKITKETKLNRSLLKELFAVVEEALEESR